MGGDGRGVEDGGSGSRIGEREGRGQWGVVGQVEGSGWKYEGAGTVLNTMLTCSHHAPVEGKGGE